MAVGDEWSKHLLLGYEGRDHRIRLVVDSLLIIPGGITLSRDCPKLAFLYSIGKSKEGK